MTYWGLTDGGWLGAPRGLVRPTAAQARLRRAARLVKGEWWLAPTELRTDEAGRVRFSGFPGTYEVHAPGLSADVVLGEPGHVAIQVTLSATTAPGPSH